MKIEIRTSKSTATTRPKISKDYIYPQAYHTKLKSLGGLKKKRSFCEVKFDLHRVKIIHAEAAVMLKIELVKFGDLTDEEKEEQPNNGCGKEDARYIKLSNAGRTLMILSDAIEPEDATFNRDLRSVIDAVKLAYVQGIKDGKKLRR